MNAAYTSKRLSEVLVAVRAAAVIPVDVGNVAERVELTRLPRTPASI